MPVPVDQLQIREVIIDKISRPLLAAYIAAMRGEEIIEHFDTTFGDDYNLRVRFLTRLKEVCEQDSEGVQCVRELMGRIESVFDALPTPKKHTADWTLVQLAALLPEDERRAEMKQFLAHPRRTRRQSACKFVRQSGDVRYKDALILSCQTYADHEGLAALLRIGGSVLDVGGNVVDTIAKLKERYDQAIAIERILIRDEQEALSLAQMFPMAFIWAAGRQRYAEAKPFVMERFSEALRKTHAATTITSLVHESLELGLFVWALGKLSAKEELASLAREYDINVPWQA
jgi:hypothetical protein